MKGTKDFTKQKGITLIALVITIIVMLILVAVTITMAVNGGLFENARNAGAQTNAAISAEQQLASGRVNIAGIWYDSIDAYINNQPSADQGDGKLETDPKYFKFELSDSTIVASNTPTKTTLTKTATILGINPEYASYNSENNNYYNNPGPTNPKYIQDGDIKITDIYLPSEVKYEGETYKITKISDSAFEYSELTSVVIPEGVTDIGSSAFSNCSKLSKVTIPSTVREIRYEAFSFSGLKSVVIPKGVITINDLTFQNCTNLTSVVIPEGVTTIGYAAFSGCSKLSKVSIPSTVKQIYESAFENCGFTSVFIPSSVEIIGTSAFVRISLTLREVYCEADSKPSGWHDDAFDMGPKIYWNCKAPNNN